MFNILIFGAPVSGKGTQSKMIVERYGFDYISTGDMLRQAISQGSELGRTAKEYIDRGQLVPDDLIVRLIADFLDGKHGSKGVIFDGFPRTLKQAEALKTMLNERGTDIHILLDLQVEDDELVDRLIERGKISGRSDDNPETIKARLDVYHTQTAPLATYYIGEGKHVAIKGIGRIEEIFERIAEAIDRVKDR